MSLLKSAEFLADVERQFLWYEEKEGGNLAEQYLRAVEASCQLLNQHPRLGPPGKFRHFRLRDWRFFPVFRPLNKHILFYEVSGDDVVMRRAMHGNRDLPRRLVQPPGSD
jgi:plasmid stabilization system protein ParE